MKICSKCNNPMPPAYYDNKYSVICKECLHTTTLYIPPKGYQLCIKCNQEKVHNSFSTKLARICNFCKNKG